MLHIFDQVDDVLKSLADFVVEKANASIDREGRFSFVLSGGSSPKKLFELLASETYRNKIEWSKVYFFFGDERYVPLNHAESNYLMAKNALFIPLGINHANVFPIDTSLSPAGAALAYENTIKTYFCGKPEVFDLILLGLGDNSHTASLFPNTKLLYEKNALVKEEYIDEVRMYRVTLTAPLINRAAQVAFLVYGAGKAIAVHHILEDDRNIDLYPAQLIAPEQGELHWFLDTPASKKLTAIL